jgi:hypothetical protein
VAMSKSEALAHAGALLKAKDGALAKCYGTDGEVIDYYTYDATLGAYEADALEALEWLVDALSEESA